MTGLVWPGRALVAVAALLAALAVGMVVSAAPAVAAGDATDALAQKYAPIVVVREQPGACLDGEPYLPTPVGTVLGRADVTLRGPAGESVTAPTARDLAGKGEGWYLDYPGEPLTPGCDYDTWFRQAGQGAVPTVYAHLATDPAYPGKVVMQYWFFWVYNDWNDRHEGDWEMIQLLFDAATPEQALTRSPVSVAFAQHEGSEVADWSDPKLHKDGDHVAVYPGQGSHAAYFTQAQWFGKSAAAGFGCDNTTGPGVRLEPAVVVLPSGAVTPDSAAAWLTFTGRWGEKAPSFNNGPTGPSTKTQWAAPVTWQVEQGRPTAVTVPTGAGPAARTFCNLTQSGSLLFIDLLARPLLVVVVVVGLLALLVLLVRRTDWRDSRAEILDSPRRAGQIVTASLVTLRRRFGALAGISVVLFTGLLLTQLLQRWLLRPRATSSLTDVDGISNPWLEIGTSLLVDLLVLPVASVALAAAMLVVRDHAVGRSTGAWAALRQTLRHRSGAWTVLVVYVVVTLLAASLVLLPVALWLVARWAVAPPAAVVEGLGVRPALRRSRTLTEGRRWRTLFLTLLLVWVGFSLPGVVGALLLLLTGLSFAVTNAISLVLMAVLVPVIGIGLTLLFFDLRRRAGGAEATTEAAPAPAGV